MNRSLLPTLVTYLRAAALATFCELSFAQDTANIIPFQGQLANQSGQPLSPTGPSTLVFRLYRQAVGGIAIWEESQPNISVNGGRFSVLLGSRTELPAAPNFNTTLYLGITVDDGNPATADVELRPRQALVPVISANYAKNADKLRGYDWSALFGTNNPAEGPLLDSKIADGSIQANKLKPQSIHAGLIVSNTVTAGQIAPGTITPVEIQAASLTLSALAKEVLDQLVPAGTINAYGGDTNTFNENDGWLLCDGRPINSTAYPRLFSKISTNWGSGVPNSPNNFNLPDLRGMFLRGVNGSRADLFADPEATKRTNSIPSGTANTGGLQTGNFGNLVGSFQFDIFRSHAHDYLDYYPHNVTGTPFDSYDDGDDDGHYRNASRTTEGTGGVETRPKNAYVHYIIKY